MSSRTVLILLLLGLSGCGYHNPNVRSDAWQGPPVRLHVPYWTNPTTEIRLAPEIHNALHNRFLQSHRIVLVDDPAEADYTLEGKIISIHYPGLAYDVTDTALELKAILTVSYALRDNRNGTAAWHSKTLSQEENYTIGGNPAQVEARKRQALSIMVTNLGEQIYLRVFRSLARGKGLGPQDPEVSKNIKTQPPAAQ